ncbi:MAG: glycosyltransferase [Rhodoferax sp.]|nr:glycosyltransferase [Rhodoferax sp.]
MTYSIVITTFDKRFNEFLIPLIQSIKRERPEVEIIITANGSARANFNDGYRSALLAFLATQYNCFPIVFPNFQSLAKMWNRGILTASYDRVLVLNDDLRIPSENEGDFFAAFEQALHRQPGTFKINGSFSHYVIEKRELIDVGFFDERLLGLGEEDGDFFWRYHEKFGKEIPSITLPNIDNINSDIADDGYTKGIRTAAKFNRDYIKNVKYKEVLLGGYRGMFDKRVKKQVADELQYPYELFYRENKERV